VIDSMGSDQEEKQWWEPL